LQSVFSQNEIQSFVNSKTLLLVSGGADSVYLFYQFLKLRDQHKIKFDVIHFNHHLRGEESDREQSFVEEICAQNDVPYVIKHLSFTSKSGLQERARLLRYQECFRLQTREGYRRFVTAHHRDDSLETLLMRKTRGVGLRGLTGIRRERRVKNPLDQKMTVTVLRPLVNISKKEIVKYLNENGIAHRVDSSNLEKNYFRNQIRHDVLEPWAAEDEKQQVLERASQLQVIDQYFQNRLEFLMKRYGHHVPISVWDSWPEELRFRFFCRKMREGGFKQQVEEKHFQLIQDETAKLDLDQSLFYKDNSGCYFFAQRDLDRLQDTKYLIKGCGSYYFGELGLVMHLQQVDRKAFESGKKNKKRPKSLYLARENLKFPLHLSWAHLSEKMKPYGSEHDVPLKKIYQSHRVPRYQRQFWPVLRGQKGQILAILGLESSQATEINDQTHTILKLDFY